MTAPCCGCSLQTGTKVIAWIGIISCILMFFFSIGAMLAARIHPGIVWTLFAFSIICIAPSLLLLRGACKKDVFLLKVWILIQIVVVIVIFIGAMVTQCVQCLPPIPLGMYFLYVVYKYIEELENAAFSRSEV